MLVSRFIVFLSVICFISCKPNPLPPKNYVAWVKDETNGLHKVRKVGDVTLELQYKPVDMILAEEFKGENVTKEILDKRKQELEGIQYFDLKLIDDKSSVIQNGNFTQQELQERLYYFSFKFQEDLILIDGTDTLSCVLYHFERTYNLKDVRSFVIGFEKKDKNTIKDKTLLIDSRLLGIGTIKIKIKEDDLKVVPGLDV